MVIKSEKIMGLFLKNMALFNQLSNTAYPYT